jgi:hypothetical protein
MGVIDHLLTQLVCDRFPIASVPSSADLIGLAIHVAGDDVEQRQQQVACVASKSNPRGQKYGSPILAP